MTEADTRLQALERAVRRNTRVTTLLAALLLAMVIGLFAYGYHRAHQILNPEVLVNRGEQIVETHLPGWKQEVKQRLEAASPRLAERISRGAVTTVPQARKRIEEYLDGQLEANLRKGVAISADRFRQFVQQNRPTLQEGFRAAKQDPRQTKQFIEDLRRAVDRHLGADIRKQAGVLLEMFRQLNAKLKELAQDRTDLSPADRLERQIVRILRALQQRAAKP